MKVSVRGWVLALVLAGATTAAAQVPYNQQASGLIDAAGESVVLDARGLGSLAVDIRGTFTATFEAQCTVDGTNWEAVRMTPPDTTTSVTSTASPGVWTGSTIAGCRSVRVIPVAWTSGSVTVYLRGIQGGGGGTGGGGGGGDASEATLQDVATATAAVAAGMTGPTLGVDVKFIDGVAPTDDLTFDFDSGAGTATHSAFGIAVPGSGAAVQVAGTASGLNVRINQATNGNQVIACDSVFVINTAAGGNVELVALTGSATIYVCAYTITSEATVDMRLVTGTGSACATDETSVTGLYALSTTTGVLGVSRGTGIGMVTKGALSSALCIETSGAVQINGEVTYTKF